MAAVTVLAVDAPLESNTSAAVQMMALAEELSRRGRKVVLLVPQHGDYEQSAFSALGGGMCVCRVLVPDLRARGHLFRTINEAVLPLRMYFALRKVVSAKAKVHLVCYSPSIFLSFLGAFLKVRQRCLVFLILRDFFPDWAAQLGLIKRGPAYFILKGIANIQFIVSDIIGVQAKGDVRLLPSWVSKNAKRKVLVVNNWLPDPADASVSDLIEPKVQLKSDPRLRGKTICVYTGNLGIAQDVGKICRFVKICAENTNLAFLFIGSGAYKEALAEYTRQNQLHNCVLMDTIPMSSIYAVCSQCDLGLVSLDARHESHHVPGKFLTYLQAGLPVVATINKGNELLEVIESNGLGVGDYSDDVEAIAFRVLELLDDRAALTGMSKRCRDFFRANYSISEAAAVVCNELGGKNSGRADRDGSEKQL